MSWLKAMFPNVPVGPGSPNPFSLKTRWMSWVIWRWSDLAPPSISRSNRGRFWKSTLREQVSRRRQGSYLRMRIFRSWLREERPGLLWSLAKRRELSLMRLNQRVCAMRPGWAWRRASSIILATFELFAARTHLRGYFPGICPSNDGGWRTLWF